MHSISTAAGEIAAQYHPIPLPRSSAVSHSLTRALSVLSRPPPTRTTGSPNWTPRPMEEKRHTHNGAHLLSPTGARTSTRRAQAKSDQRVTERQSPPGKCSARANRKRMERIEGGERNN